MTRTAGRDRGAATVVAAAAVGVLVLLLGLGLQLGAAVLARHRAESAADLAALAGAVDAVRGQDVACARARKVAASNGAVLESCEWHGWTLTARVTYPCTCALTVSGITVGRARAGPMAPGSRSNAEGPVTPREHR